MMITETAKWCNASQDLRHDYESKWHNAYRDWWSPSDVTMEQTQTTTFKTTDENRPAYNESCAHKHVGSKLEQEL